MQKSNHINYGLVTAGAMIALSLLTYVLKQQENQWLSYLGLLILAIGVILSCTNFAKINDGNVTFGNVFSVGFKTTAVIIVITTLVTVILILAMPHIKEQAMETARVKMQEQGKSTDEINMALDITSRFFLVFVIGFSVFFSLLTGLVASLIGAGVAKKNPSIQ